MDELFFLFFRIEFSLFRLAAGIAVGAGTFRFLSVSTAAALGLHVKCCAVGFELEGLEFADLSEWWNELLVVSTEWFGSILVAATSHALVSGDGWQRCAESAGGLTEHCEKISGLMDFDENLESEFGFDPNGSTTEA